MGPAPGALMIWKTSFFPLQLFFFLGGRYGLVGIFFFLFLISSITGQRGSASLFSVNISVYLRLEYSESKSQNNGELGRDEINTITFSGVD